MLSDKYYVLVGKRLVKADMEYVKIIQNEIEQRCKGSVGNEVFN